jgi:molybdopterin synthase sulfur carrier subunit
VSAEPEPGFDAAMLFEVTAIRLPPILRSDAGGQRQLEVGATTVKGALEELVGQYPSLRGRVFDGEAVPPFLNVFVDGQDIRVLDGLETQVGSAATILLLPAVAGG